MVKRQTPDGDTAVTEPTLRERINAYMRTTVDGYDLEQHYEDGGAAPDDLFRAALDYGTKINSGEHYYACGSTAVESKNRSWRRNSIVETTPIALYRLLYLIRPDKVDFSSMYKADLFVFRSQGRRFLVEVSLYKYELCLYFYCPKDALGIASNVTVSSIPGTATEWNCTDPDGVAFFAMVVKAVSQKWQIYSGNNFDV